MSLQMPTADTDIDLWLGQQTDKSLLRFLTCGSVDDGKSTLIGRLLYDSQLILDDQLASLRSESRNRTTGDEGIDFSLLVDGLSAEREQGITIDVAYRFFSTDKRKFIVADTPGHEQYTRNMATGASNADLALVLIDARKGVLTQTRRHSFILSLIGVKHVVLVVNKIDLVDYDEAVFERIVAEYRAFAEPLGFKTLAAVPVSALRGAGAVSGSHRDSRGPGCGEIPLPGAVGQSAQSGFPRVLRHGCRRRYRGGR
jgi:bifunctional enzyme CysN/CysC